ncbi:MAG: hypothetical protein JJE04_09300 [Acidobacteriia bacterium]|nr:hypothetical protein [Terriglobia bacterium]
MNDTLKKAAVGCAFVLLLIAAWFSGSWFRLSGPNLWLYRISFGVLSVSGLLAFLWMRSRRSPNASSSGGGAVPAGGAAVDLNQLDVLFRESAEKLSASKLARNLSGLPAVLLIGGPASGKTTALVRSDLEPELIAGQAFQDGQIVPTQALNFFIARNSLFVDVGGSLLPSQEARTRLFKRLRPGRLGSIFGRSSQAPRVAVVTVDCESLVAAGASESLAASARLLRESLSHACRTWGINLPVYVLFTRMDQIRFFSEYVAQLTQAEATCVLGATLPFRGASQTGTYAEVESKRLTEALQSLNFWLADKRPDVLSREHDGAKLPGIYQFPREFAKLRTLITQFLVDLCRPSQLHSNPFLRGFYFTGVRAVVVRDVAVAPSRKTPQQEALLTDATGIFGAGSKAPPEASPRLSSGRKVPQWVFLSHLFPDVILRDGAAQSTSSASMKSDSWRRALLAAAAVFSLIYLTGATVSYFNNRAIQEEALAATQALNTTRLAENELPSLAALQRLETLRVVADRLTQYDLYRPPMSLRWGLYSGGDLQASVSRIYFGHFRTLLLNQTQVSLLNLMSRPSAAQALGYKPVYDTLKAYLMTTSNPDKSSESFLTPVLMHHWTNGRTIDPARLDLVRAQFAFYSRQLLIRNPFPSFAKPDAGAVRIARDYLSKFAGAETLYQAMLDAASRKFPVIRFNQQHPGSAEVVRNDYPIAGAFTKGGWAFMQDAIRRPDVYFSGERWVMGDTAFVNLDLRALSGQLQKRYRDHFGNEWAEFLRKTSIVRYGGIPDAANKLQKTSSIQSPLLTLLCITSENTAVEEPAVAELFQPAQFVTAPGCQQKLSGQSNLAYMDGLIKLQASLQQLTSNIGSEALRGEAIGAATSALVAARQTAQNFRIDNIGQTHALVQKLLIDPITYAQESLLGAQVEPLNAAGRGFCADLRGLMAKYPFQPKSTTQASLGEVAAIFHPRDGALWKLYQEHVSKLVTRQGNSFTPVPGPIMVTTQFLDFFQRMAAVSQSFYKDPASPQPRLDFTLQPAASEGIEGVTVSINGQSKRSGGAAEAWQFAWPGSGAPEAKLQVKLGGGSDLAYVNFNGLWAAFQFVATADRFEPAGAAFSLEWTLRTSVGDVISPKTGKPVVVRFMLSMGGGPPVLRPGYLSSLSCVSTVARNR